MQQLFYSRFHGPNCKPDEMEVKGANYCFMLAMLFMELKREKK